MNTPLTSPDEYPHQFRLLVGLTTALTFDDTSAVERFVAGLTEKERFRIRTTLLEVLKYLPLDEELQTT